MFPPLYEHSQKRLTDVIEASRSENVINGQADRPISIPKLKPLRALHTGPINLVVYKVPDGDIHSRGELGA